MVFLNSRFQRDLPDHYFGHPVPKLSGAAHSPLPVAQLNFSIKAARLNLSCPKTYNSNVLDAPARRSERLKKGRNFPIFKLSTGTGETLHEPSAATVYCDRTSSASVLSNLQSMLS